MPVDLSEIKEFVFNKLTGLDIHFTYHNTAHTSDVLYQVERIATSEKLINEDDVFLLKVAALYHDTGFLKKYEGHELVSVAIFLEDANRFGFTKQQQEIIEGLILATQVPQKPAGILQQIICDADLDYLAREDFYVLKERLRKEFLYFKLVANDAEWEEMQLKFFGNHHYHTHSSQMQREPFKKKHFAELLSHP